jgi:uncharacterized protein with HEPN domain
MPRDPRKYLWDIQAAADAIQTFVAGLDLHSYASTDVVHSAVERKFEIIGEALSQLARHDPALAARIPDPRQVIAFRNVLIHGYAEVGPRARVAHYRGIAARTACRRCRPAR